MMGRYRGVFFDMDGTVADTISLWDHIIGTIKSEYDLDMAVLEKSDGFNLSNEDAIRVVLEDAGRFSESLHSEILCRIDTLYEAFLASFAGLEDGICRTLERLEEAGVKMVLVSNSSRRQVDMCLSHLGIADFFCGTVTSDDVTEAKPSAEPYLRALEISGLDREEVVAVEDSETGARAASAASMPCILIYDGSPVPSSPGLTAVPRHELETCLLGLVTPSS